MYRCLECGQLFEEGEQVVWNEDRGEFWGSRCSEKLSGCPLCKGEYEKIEPCKICGSYYHEADEEYCEECKKRVRQEFQTFLSTHFTTQEKDLLNEMYDGEYF